VCDASADDGQKAEGSQVREHWADEIEKRGRKYGRVLEG
jgi:hypothetical protein